MDNKLINVLGNYESSVFLGCAGVDSGQLLITDPCYLTDKKTFEYKNMETDDYKPLINRHGACLGIVTRTHVGDGAFPIYAIYTGDGKSLLRFEILIEQENVNKQKENK